MADTPPTSIAGTHLLSYLIRQLESVMAHHAELEAQIATFSPSETLDGDDLAAHQRLVRESIGLQPAQNRLRTTITMVRGIINELAFLNLPDPVSLAIADIQRTLVGAEADKAAIDELPEGAISSDTEMAQHFADGRINACKAALLALTGTPETAPADQIMVAAQAIQRLAGEAAQRANALDSRGIPTWVEHAEREQLRGAQNAYIAALRTLVNIDLTARGSTHPDPMAGVQAEIDRIDAEVSRITEAGEKDLANADRMEVFILHTQREVWVKALALISGTTPPSAA